jgi:Phosphotransferase enzyme family
MALTYSDKERMVLTATSLLLLESSLMTTSSFDEHSSESSSASTASSPSFCSSSCLKNLDFLDIKNKDDIEWEADLLSGGYTNASYKVTARSKTTNAPIVCVFAKLAFRTILAATPDETNADEHRDDSDVDANNNNNNANADLNSSCNSSIMSDVWNHQRTDCEFIAMQYLHEHLPAMPLPRALACINVEKNSKLLITEWTLQKGAWAEEFLQEQQQQASPMQQPIQSPPQPQHQPAVLAVPVSPLSKRSIVGGGYTSSSTHHHSSSNSSSSRIINRARIASVAQAFARLNSLPYDTLQSGKKGAIQKDFNPSGRTYQASVMPVAREVFLVLLQQQAHNLRPTDRVALKVQSYGAATCAAMAHNMEEDYLHNRVCLCHGDAHAFNILVKPENNAAAAIDRAAAEVSNDIVVIDWELCIVGPRGRDLGMLLGWPIACALWHAHQWRDLIAFDILASMDHLWTCYAQELMLQQPNLSPDDLAAIYRNGLAWCGWFLFVSLYVFGVTMEHFTYEVDTEAEHEKVLESIGMVGLQLLHLGFVQESPDDAAAAAAACHPIARRPYSLEELQSRFRSIVQLEIRLARPFPKPPPPSPTSVAAARTKRQKRRFPSYLRSISVQSWSSSFSEDDVNCAPLTQSLHNAATNDHKIASSMSTMGGAAVGGGGPLLRRPLSASCSASSCTSFLPRRSVSALALDHPHVPDKITPSDSELPFVIPIMPPPRSRSCNNSLHGSNSSSSSGGESGTQQHTTSYKFIYR